MINSSITATRPLGATGLQLAPLSLGGAGILMDRGAAATDEEAAAVVRFALEGGIRLVDTSPIYGTDDDPRRSERRVGQGLDSLDCVVATKVGLLRGQPASFALSGPGTRESIDASRLALQRATLDIVQVHELTEATWRAAFATGGAVDTLQQLREEGAVRHIGVTGSDPTVLERAVRTGRFETVQLWRAWTLLDQSGDALLAAAASLGVGILIAAPFASGILAREDASGELHYETAPGPQRERVRRMGRQCIEAGVSLRAAALRFCLDPRVCSVIAGVQNHQQLNELLLALAEPVPASLLDALREEA